MLKGAWRGAWKEYEKDEGTGLGKITLLCFVNGLVLLSAAAVGEVVVVEILLIGLL